MALLAVTAALWLMGCAHRTQQPMTLSGETQGTYYSVIYYDSLHRDMQPLVDSLLHTVDITASLWVDTSLLCRVNRNETDTLTPLFADMLRKSLGMAEYTHGAFDCTVGALVQAWGFATQGPQNPARSVLDSLRRYTGLGRIALHDGGYGVCRIVKQHMETRLDFNAIAQGITSDLIAHALCQRGIRNCLVDVGGEVVARGAKPDGTPWVVGIERPAKNKYSSPQVALAIALHNASVVTSGSYRKYYEKDGVRYSHTIDPATGRPVRHSLLSVSVVDSVAWRADALATAFMVMGLDSSRRFIASHPLDSGAGCALFLYDSAGCNAEWATPAFKKLIINQENH